jgi:two-component system OmpR family sensor kinase
MKRYLLALLPALLGLVAAVAWQAGFWADPVLYLRADVGTLCLLLGVAGSAGCALALAVWSAAGRRHERALAALRQAQADSHHRFVRRLDHEMKNPLTAIRASLANLAVRPEQATLVAVRTQVDRLARLSADLRKLAGLESQALELEPVDLGELLEEVAEAARDQPEAAARHLQLTLPRAPWPLSPVAADRDLLFLALYNLLDNALKYTRPGDAVEVRAFEDGATVAVEVADTGPGIPEEELPHLGEELYRGSAPRSVEGSGLGRAIVIRHGGTVSIRSRVGQGTAVTLRVPVAR